MNKAKKIIGLLKHLNRYLPLNTLIQMYKSLVRPHVEYCDVIFHLPSINNPPPMGISLPSLMSKIESIQYQAALAVTGTWKGTNRVKLYEELGWESLSDRSSYKRIIQLYKIINKMTPSYLLDKLPLTRRNLIELPNIFQEIRSRTLRYQNSFFPNAIHTWKLIISHFDDYPGLNQLKCHLLSLFRPNSKPIFGIHDPIGIRYVFQL